MNHVSSRFQPGDGQSVAATPACATPPHPDPDLAAISRVLTELADAIDSRPGIQDATRLARRARELAAEVTKPRPERGRVDCLLSLLSAGTQPVGDLAFSVAMLKAAMFGLPGIG